MAAAAAVGKQLVCVTGANGFVASWVVERLLRAGYRVRGTVRDPSNAAKVGHLHRLEGASERLELVQADLLAPSAFDEAVEGCEGVFHTASPFFWKTEDPEKDLLQPAKEGTLNVLRSVVKAGNRPKVVLTSSVAAVAYKKSEEGHVYDEEDWSDEGYLRHKKIWYPLSKTIAERAAWEFVENLAPEKRFGLVTVNPVLVTGPALQSTLNTSSEVVKKMVDGSSDAIQNAQMMWVDVRDVADAHVHMYEGDTPGRLLCCGGTTHYDEIAPILRRLAPHLADGIPSAVQEGERAAGLLMSQAKAKSVGVEFTSLEDTMKATLDTLFSNGHLPSPAKL